MTASSAAGTTIGATRPIGRTAQSTGMNTVASPRSCWKISLAYSPPLGPAGFSRRALTIACSSPSAPCHQGKRSGRSTTSRMPMAGVAGTVRCSIGSRVSGRSMRFRSELTASRVRASSVSK
jgi:hypothetical protein